MEMILKFNLPEEQDEANLASSAGDLWSVLWDLDQRLRSLLKYDNQGYDPETIEAIRETLRIYMESYDLSFDMVR